MAAPMDEETSTLFRLPFSLLCNILSQWLTVDSLSVFDIAVGETESRKLVLESLFPSAEFVLEDNSISQIGRAERNIRRDGRSFLYWLHKRRLSIRNVDLRGWNKITEEGLGLLSERCLVLRTLNLTGLREDRLKCKKASRRLLHATGFASRWLH